MRWTYEKLISMPVHLHASFDTTAVTFARSRHFISPKRPNQNHMARTHFHFIDSLPEHRSESSVHMYCAQRYLQAAFRNIEIFRCFWQPKGRTNVGFKCQCENRGGRWQAFTFEAGQREISILCPGAYYQHEIRATEVGTSSGRCFRTCQHVPVG